MRSVKRTLQTLLLLLPMVLCIVLVLLVLFHKQAPAPAPETTEARSTEVPTTELLQPPFDPADPLLILVNGTHPLPEDDTPELQSLRDWDASVATALYPDLCQLLAAANQEGLRITVCSAYRSRETQQTLWDRAVAEGLASGLDQSTAEAQAEQYHMRPGCSEHETGLALDLVSRDYQLLDDRQGDTPECCWLRDHAWEYGFILRYPKEKEAITGVSWEPWHFRYVGKEAAAWLRERDLTLEELYALLEGDVLAGTGPVRLSYGTSGSGQHDLTAWRIGTGPNVLLLTFALHGWDDGFERDGTVLAALGEQTVDLLRSHGDLIAAGGWTVYVVPCANPDGAYEGTGPSGPGRCTTWLYDDAGTSVWGEGLGIDLNRSFPYDFQPMTDPRNYNGTRPLQCAEAEALAAFTQKIKGTGRCLCMDVHGWYGQIITADRDGDIYRVLSRSFPGCTPAGLGAGSGYFSAWCQYEQGWEACLLELPGEFSSPEHFWASAVPDAFQNAVISLLALTT